MNTTMAVVNKVSAYVTDKTQPLDTIRAALNAPAYDNPAPQATVNPPLSFAAMAAAVDPVNLGKLMTYDHLDVVIADLRRGDYDAATLWVQGLVAAGILSTTDATNIAKTMTPTPDPTWRARLSWVEVNFGAGQVLTDIDMDDCAKYGKWPGY